MKSIGTSGFNEAERQLLIKQINIVCTKIKAGWEYLGETGDADLVFVQSRGSAPNHEKTVSIRNARQDEESQTIESPIRLMQLTTILEQHSEGIYSQALFLLGLFSSKLSHPSCIELGTGRAYLYPKENLIGGHFDSAEEMISELNNANLIDAKIQGQPTNINPTTLPLLENSRRVIWRLARNEQDFANSRYTKRHKYGLSVWPRGIRWEKDPSYTRLTAAFSRHAIDIATAANAANVTIEQTKLFLHCCESTGVAIHTHPLGNTNINHPPTKQDKTSMSWLKKRIRKMLHHDN